jgi:hypothetical protein
MIHQQMDHIQWAPIKFRIRVEIHWYACAGPEIAFHSVNQMRLFDKDFRRGSFSSIIIPMIPYNDSINIRI